MFALTVEQLSRVEYKPSKKEELKAAKKLAERKDLTRNFECERNTAPGGYRSPIVARRKLRMIHQMFGPGGRRGSLTSTSSGASNGASSTKSSISGGS